MLNRLGKQFLAGLLLLPLSASLASPVLAQTANPYENLGASSAALNAISGKYMAGRAENQVLPLASLTKLMTALVLLDLGPNFDKKVVINSRQTDYVTPYIEAGDITSKIDLRKNDKVTMRNLWHAMLIASSNEAAIALVDNSGLTRQQFVSRMNRKAKALGLTKTKFTEPSGIDPKNIGTAKEMAIIARKAYAYTSIRTASALSTYKFKDLASGRKINIYSRNTSLLAMKPLGMKVGYLTEAKLNVAVRLKKNGKDRIIVILHAPSSSSRNVEINRLMTQ